VAFFQVTEIKPPREAQLEEVKERVRAEVREEKALAVAREQAQRVHDRAREIGLDKAASALKLVRKETPNPVGRGQALGDLGEGAAVEAAAFGLPEKELSGPVRSAGGYAVLRVLERKSADPATLAAQRSSVESSLLEQKRQQLFEAFMSGARDRYRVERYPQALRRVLGQV
jgi:parvulin-like peptidyl-prolyl isomerase